MDRIDNIISDLRANAARGDTAATQTPQPAPRRGRAPRRSGAPAEKGPALGGSRRLRALTVAAGGLVLVVFVVIPALGRPTSKDAQAPATAAVTSPTSETMSPVAEASDTSAIPQPQDWQQVLEELDRRRSEAIIARDTRALASVDAPGSAALARDRALIRSLTQQGLHAAAVPLRVASVTEQFVAQGPQAPRAVLTVVDAMASYDLTDDRGAVVRRVDGRPRRTWEVELRKVSGRGWVYVSAVPAVTPTSP